MYIGMGYIGTFYTLRNAYSRSKRIKHIFAIIGQIGTPRGHLLAFKTPDRWGQGAHSRSGGAELSEWTVAAVGLFAERPHYVNSDALAFGQSLLT